MCKKRARQAETVEKPAKSKTAAADADNSEDEDFDMINVDFEWFNFDKDIDFHGVKNLFRQLLDADSALFDLSALADLIVSENTIGSTVKVDSKENDAYAFLTVLNTTTHAQNPAMVQLVNYLIEKAGTNPSLAPVGKILKTDGAQLGLVISERMLNMPPEVAPPMYSLLLDEVEAAVEDKEPFEFTHWLVLTRTYAEVESTLDQETERKKKKAKGQAALFYFHPEDEVFVKHAAAHGGYEFTKGEETSADSKRAFQEMGIKTQGHLILIEASRFEGAVKAANDYIKPPA